MSQAHAAIYTLKHEHVDSILRILRTGIQTAELRIEEIEVCSDPLSDAESIWIQARQKDIQHANGFVQILIQLLCEIEAMDGLDFPTEDQNGQAA